MKDGGSLKPNRCKKFELETHNVWKICEIQISVDSSKRIKAFLFVDESVANETRMMILNDFENVASK